MKRISPKGHPKKMFLPPPARPLLSAWTAVALCAAMAGPVASGPAQGPSQAAVAPVGPPGTRAVVLGPDKFQVLERDSGPVNYYRTIDDPQQAFIRGVYRPGLQTVTLFAEAPEDLRRGVRLVRWRWRAPVLPREGDQCAGRNPPHPPPHGHRAWKTGARWYPPHIVRGTQAPLCAPCPGQRQ